MTEKNKKIIRDAEDNGTPIFILTAKDKISSETIADYLQNCITAGCNPDHLTGISQRLTEFLRYQQNDNLVKLPD